MNENELIQWMMVFLRVTGLMTIFPIFSMSNIPIKVRVSLGAMLAFLVSPTLTGDLPQPNGMLGVVGIMALELGVGLLLGFICRLMFYILEFAGSLISLEMGLNMASTISPFSQSRTELPGMFLFYLGAVLFLSLDLHHWLLLGFQQTYDAVPVGGAGLSEELFDDIVQRTSKIFLYGLLMSAPIVAVAFLINLVFSVLSRAVPQMNIFIESFAFRILAGLVVFGMTLNLMAQHIINFLKEIPNDLLHVAQMLGLG